MNEAFVKIVRRHLKYLEAGDELAPDASLKGLGLDSMEAVTLMLELEDEFNIMLPDSQLTAETFATPANLWDAINPLRSS